jgi:hypothetical protein
MARKARVWDDKGHGVDKCQHTSNFTVRSYVQLHNKQPDISLHKEVRVSDMVVVAGVFLSI